MTTNKIYRKSYVNGISVLLYTIFLAIDLFCKDVMVMWMKLFLTIITEYAINSQVHINLHH